MEIHASKADRSHVTWSHASLNPTGPTGSSDDVNPSTPAHHSFEFDDVVDQICVNRKIKFISNTTGATTLTVALTA